jgi:hypothetical protein
MPDCTAEPVVGIGTLDGPPVWLCTEHADAHLAGVLAVVEAVVAATTSRG